MDSQTSYSSQALIEVAHVGKSYQLFATPRARLKYLLFGRRDPHGVKEHRALSDISLTVNRGTSFGIVGRNGAGKSTLLQIIAGTVRQSCGDVIVRGRVAAVLELGAGFNLQFTGAENIRLYCNLMMMPPQLVNERFDSIVEFSGVGDYINQPLSTYSSGMVARLAFSVIAHVDADILIIDEALSVGDAEFAQKCMRFLEEFRSRGCIFFVTHDVSAVRRFCDQAMWLDNGCVRAMGEAGHVCDQYLADVYPSRDVRLDHVDESVASEDAEDSFSVVGTAVSRGEGIDGSVSESRAKSFFNLERSITESNRGNVVVQRLSVSRWNPASSSFGTGEAEIYDVRLVSEGGTALGECTIESVGVLTVSVRANRAISRAIVGFSVKDRLGQPLFGANTSTKYCECKISLLEGECISVRFSFRIPVLQRGQYSVSAAVAEGSLERHLQLHWVHDALQFEVHETLRDGVLVGVPMLSVSVVSVN